MRMRILVPSLAVLGVLAAPAMAQGFYSYDYNGPAITGAQMSDLPSERANVTRSGSFLRPEMRGAERIHVYRDVYRDRHPYRVYRDYDGDGR